jgi:hypothetical protein
VGTKGQPSCLCNDALRRRPAAAGEALRALQSPDQRCRILCRPPVAQLVKHVADEVGVLLRSSHNTRG